MNPFLHFGLLSLGSVLVGGLFGFLAQLAGFSGIKGYTTWPGGAQSCGCVAFIICAVFVNVALGITASVGGVLLLLLLGTMLFLFGFLKGLSWNPWKLFGQSENIDEIAGPDLRLGTEEEREGVSSQHPSEDPDKHRIDVEWPALDDLENSANRQDAHPPGSE